MTIIEKIKAEIERRITDNTFGAKLELIDILAWLDTLESERPEPYNPVYDEAYLNEKIKKATESWKGVDVDAMLAECRGYDEEKSEKPMNLEGLEEELDKWRHEHFHGKRDDHFSGEYLERTSQLELARHFAEWGAEHFRDTRKTLEIKPGDEVTINGHKIVYDKDKGYVTIVKSEESVPNDLEEAADNHVRRARDTPGRDWTTQDIADAFVAGAKWQAEQFEKNRLASCDNMSEEEYDRETDFVESIIEKEHRQPTFSDAINYGMRLQKEQMMKEAVDAIVEDWNPDPEPEITIPLNPEEFTRGDKVRVIVLPKEE